MRHLTPKVRFDGDSSSKDALGNVYLEIVRLIDKAVSDEDIHSSNDLGPSGRGFWKGFPGSFGWSLALPNRKSYIATVLSTRHTKPFFRQQQKSPPPAAAFRVPLHVRIRATGRRTAYLEKVKRPCS